jgi:hypothetical protein
MRHLGNSMAAVAIVLAAGLPAAAQPTGTSPGTSQGHGTAATPNGGASPADTSDTTVGKVGAALRDVVHIKQSYAERLQAAKSPTEQQDLSKQASGEAVASISQHGLTIDQYNHVIQAAQTDPALKQRVLAAAKTNR